MSKMTKVEKEFVMLVKELPCCVCNPEWFDRMIEKGWKFQPTGVIRSEADHLVDGKRLGHLFCNPLCRKHHEGKKRYGDPAYHWDSSKPNQWKLFERVCAVLQIEVPIYNPKGRNNFKGEA